MSTIFSKTVIYKNDNHKLYSKVLRIILNIYKKYIHIQTFVKFSLDNNNTLPLQYQELTNKFKHLPIVYLFNNYLIDLTYSYDTVPTKSCAFYFNINSDTNFYTYKDLQLMIIDNKTNDIIKIDNPKNSEQWLLYKTNNVSDNSIYKTHGFMFSNTSDIENNLTLVDNILKVSNVKLDNHVMLNMIKNGSYLYENNVSYKINPYNIDLYIYDDTIKLGINMNKFNDINNSEYIDFIFNEVIRIYDQLLDGIEENTDINDIISEDIKESIKLLDDDSITMKNVIVNATSYIKSTLFEI